MSQPSDISVKIDVIDKIDVATDVKKNITTDTEKNDKPHNGKPITMIEVSPKGTYLVIYSQEDKSIIGWNVTNVENEFQLKPDDYCHIIHEYYENKNMINMCVSNDKKLAYIYFSYSMNKLKNEFILYNRVDRDKNNIWIYSTQTNNKWMCKRIYEIPKDYDVISISKYDKLYLLFSNIYIHEWDLLTEKSIRMFVNEEKIESKDIKISSNEKFIYLKIKDKIIIYSIELEIPIITLDANNVSTEIDVDIEKNQKIEALEIQQETEKEIKTSEKTKEQTNIQNFGYIDLLSSEICISTMLNHWEKNDHKFILDGYGWKIKLLRMNVLFKAYEFLNIHLFNLYINDIHAFLRDYKDGSGRIDHDFCKEENNSIRWEIRVIEEYKFEIKVFKKSDESDAVCTRIENFQIWKNLLNYVELSYLKTMMLL
ncbi:hypothetical protein C1645_737829 [Glomus cerebriforme]|uniref:Uncharacterized protein n=1 Tax=Glomus cerebriforme TaxID=658196 RepID=A0A397SWA3_9GLOM|nr:hypothetical protein C1645_737829 [Glomus cerebriforme]